MRCLGRSIYSPYKIIVEIGCANRILGLLERQKTAMIKSGLLENGEGRRVTSANAVVSLACPLSVTKKLRSEKPWLRLFRLECANAAKNLASVKSRHSNGRNGAGSLIQIEVGRKTDIDIAVGKVDRALGVVCKAREEFLSHGDFLVCLTAHCGQLARHHNVIAVAEHPCKGITGKRTSLGLLPSQDQPRIQSARQGHAYRLTPLEIPRKVSRKNAPHLLVVWLCFQRLLVLPFLRFEILSLFNDGAVAKDPLGSCGQHMDALEK